MNALTIIVASLLINEYFIHNVKALGDVNDIVNHTLLNWDLSDKYYKSLEGSVTFYMCSINKPFSLRQIYANRKSIKDTNAGMPWKCLVIAIHGWHQNKNYSFEKELPIWVIRYACVAISVDWSSARFSDYVQFVKSVPFVGKQVAKFVDLIVQTTELPLNQIYFIGHSLGAHVAGFSARSMKTGKPSYISALDPAGPLFNKRLPEDRLNADDSIYVECIMTNIGLLGIKKPICQASFIINGGIFQPGCSLGAICSHTFSVVVHYEALKSNRFYSSKCQNFNDALLSNCSNKLSEPRMGDLANYPNHVKGIFYTPISDVKPTLIF